MLDEIKECATGPCAQKVLYFEEMLTPKVIRIVYWLSLLAAIWVGVGKMFSGGLDGFFEGVVWTVIALIMARVAAELIILFFKIQEDIEQVAANTKAAPAQRKKAAKKITKKPA